MKSATELPSRLLLNYVIWRTEMPHRAVRACGAENLTDKKTSPQKRLQSVSESLRLFVPIGFVPVVVCATMLKWTCVERKTGVSIGYDHTGLLLR